uniref:Fungal lipase-like domain-containing protein n=1 Tax=Acrobeloides nanus TaxID=290746 RepID=A0A914CHI6_9BILA
MQLVKRYEVECDVLKNTCSGYLAISPFDRAISFIFRGSSIPQYLYENFFFATYSQKDFEAGGKVLTYWHDAFYCLWNSGISEDLQQLIREYPDYELWVFGHSLGGVLASLSTMVTITRGIFPAERIKYISFGEPRIGNVVFAQSFDALVPYKYRIVREHDLIPNQPQNLDLWDVIRSFTIDMRYGTQIRCFHAIPISYVKAQKTLDVVIPDLT